MVQRITIEDGLSLYNKTGIGQYTENLYNLFTLMGYKVNLKRKPFLEKIKNSVIKRFLYILWINIIFPIKIIFDKSDKIIFTNTITPLFKIPGKKYYPVLHDLWSVKSNNTVTLSQSIYLKIVLFSIKHNYEKIITVSETIKKEIVEYFNCKDKDVNVIYNYFSFGEKPSIYIDEEEQEKILQKYNLKNKKYILSVATLNKRKNIPMLIEAFNKLKPEDIKLVLVGKASSEKFNCTNENIIFTGYIGDEELKVLYKNALLYVFPSVYEGFGIPIIDAQSFGIPVLCSDISVFHEIGGDSVEYFTQENLIQKLQYTLEQPKYRENLINCGYRNIEKYSKENIKEQLQFVLLQ